MSRHTHRFVSVELTSTAQFFLDSGHDLPQTFAVRLM